MKLFACFDITQQIATKGVFLYSWRLGIFNLSGTCLQYLLLLRQLLESLACGSTMPVLGGNSRNHWCMRKRGTVWLWSVQEFLE